MALRNVEFGLNLVPAGIVAVEAFVRIQLPTGYWILTVILLAGLLGGYGGWRLARWWDQKPAGVPTGAEEERPLAPPPPPPTGPPRSDDGAGPAAPGWTEPRRTGWQQQCPYCTGYHHSAGWGRQLPPNPNPSSGLRYYAVRVKPGRPDWTPGVYCGYARLQEVLRGGGQRGDYIGAVSFEEAAAFVLRDRTRHTTAVTLFL